MPLRCGACGRPASRVHEEQERLDKRRLREQFAEPDWSYVRVIGVDEFALHRGHRYATVVVEPSRKRVLWVGRGRSRLAFRPFFRQLGEAGCARL